MAIRDLESLVQSCWNEKARAHASESLRAYNAGAYRSCIVAAWTAVVYDFIEKLRFLADRGDKNAEVKLTALKKALSEYSGGDFKLLEQFERSIVEWAHRDFELITAIEASMLVRLKLDRNLCAHPSMSSLDEVYSPTAEQARLSLVVALEALLTKEPVHGPNQVQSIIALIEGDSFPTDLDIAVRVLERSPLGRARTTLFRNVMVVLLKGLLSEGPLDSKSRVIALAAMHKMFAGEFESLLPGQLDLRVQRELPNHLRSVVTLVQFLPSSWHWLPEDIQLLVETTLASTEDSEFLIAASTIPQLKSHALPGASRVAPSKFAELFIAGALQQSHLDIALEAFARSDSFPEARGYYRNALRLLIEHFETHHIERLFRAIVENTQVRWLNETEALLQGLVEHHGDNNADAFRRFHDTILETEPNREYVEFSTIIANALPSIIPKKLAFSEGRGSAVVKVDNAATSESE